FLRAACLSPCRRHVLHRADGTSRRQCVTSATQPAADWDRFSLFMQLNAVRPVGAVQSIQKGLLMRKYLFAATAALVVGAPAAAQSAGPYVGIEGGIQFPRSTSVDATVSDSTGTLGTVGDAGRIRYKNGYDVDAIAGYKFGLFRLEGELG